MGGRGAASMYYRLHGKNLKYGDEYSTIFQTGNVKFVKMKNGSATAPLETMPSKIRKPNGRIYVTVNKNGPKFVTFYDSFGKRRKQIDLDGGRHSVDVGGKMVDLGFPHTHLGYDQHHKNSSRFSTGGERMFVRLMNELWRKHNGES